MKQRYRLRVTLCIVLSLLMLVDFAIFNPAPAFALDAKSVAVGAGVGVAAGAGIVLAAPAIGGAMAAAGAGIAGVGGAIIGGVAAVAGGIVGAVAAVGGAIASAVGAIGGFIAGIIASPLFIPALIVIGAAVAGYFIYKHYKAKRAGNASAPGSDEVLPGGDEIFVTPGDYEMTGVMPTGDVAAPVSIGDSDVITIGGDVIAVSDEAPVVTTQPAAQAPAETPAVTGIPTSNDSLKAAHDRYIAAYQKYTSLVTSGGGANPQEVKDALTQYREAYNDYQTLRMTGSR